MDASELGDWLFDMLPFKRKSAADWIVPGLVGLGVGMIAGAGVGMLLAPEPGEVTRNKLREGANRVKERASELADRAREQITRPAEQRSLANSNQLR